MYIYIYILFSGDAASRTRRIGKVENIGKVGKVGKVGMVGKVGQVGKVGKVGALPGSPASHSPRRDLFLFCGLQGILGTGYCTNRYLHVDPDLDPISSRFMYPQQN